MGARLAQARHHSFRDKLSDNALQPFLALEFLKRLLEVLPQVPTVLGCPPAAVMEATQQYLRDQDRNPVRQWLYENYDLVPDAGVLEDKSTWIGAAELYNAFLQETGTASASTKLFCRQVQGLPPEVPPQPAPPEDGPGLAEFFSGSREVDTGLTSLARPLWSPRI